MTATNSLAACNISNRLSELHSNGTGMPSNMSIYVHPFLNMRFIGRYCTINGEHSGGYVIRACLEEQYKHQTGMKQWQEKRLSKGWTPKTKQRAIHRLIHALAELRTIMRHREQVYVLAESRDLNLDWIDEIAAGENREIAYSNMTIADCEFWKIELGKYPSES